MATVLERQTTVAAEGRHGTARGYRSGPAYQGYSLLYFGYIALPLIAGFDKFTDFLVNWDQYLAPIVASVVPAAAFMKVVGVIEIVAGLLVALKPRIGAFIVGCWLLGIVGNLLLAGAYYDIALRDFGLALGAFAFWRLSYGVPDS
jgi:uncharacterized membrane protein YphA (DoxX/SURF4 family)